MNAGVCPPLGWLASRMLPPELAIGVIVATAVPCTLATAAVWTRRAGGNDAVAFLVTMITNLGCFVVVPGWLWLLSGVHAEVDYRAIVVGLILLVVVPIVLAQLLRQWRPLGSLGHAPQEVAQLARPNRRADDGAARCRSAAARNSQPWSDNSILTATNLVLLIAGVDGRPPRGALARVCRRRKLSASRGPTRSPSPLPAARKR